jgi:hypothetical protein
MILENLLDLDLYFLSSPGLFESMIRLLSSNVIKRDQSITTTYILASLIKSFTDLSN